MDVMTEDAYNKALTVKFGHSFISIKLLTQCMSPQKFCTSVLSDY